MSDRFSIRVKVGQFFLLVLTIFASQTWSMATSSGGIYEYDATIKHVFASDKEQYIALDWQSHEYYRTQNLQYCCAPQLSSSRDGTAFNGSFFALLGDFIATKGPLARGRAAEQRVLNDLGLSKNTQKVRTGEGTSIPDALTKRQSIEIKDCIGVSCTKQIRIQTEAARNSGRQSTLITGDKTHVSGPAQRAFDNIIRRPDLGPQ